MLKKLWSQVASFVWAGAPWPPGLPAFELPSPQSRNALFTVMLPGATGPILTRNRLRLAAVTVAFEGMELRLKATTPRRK